MVRPPTRAALSTSLAPLADSVDGITEAKDRRAPEGQPGARVGAGRRKQERAALIEPDGYEKGVRDGTREYRQRAGDSGRIHATLVSSATVTTRRSSTPEKDATTSTGPDDKSTRLQNVPLKQNMLPASKAVSVSATTAKAAHLTKESPPTQALSVGSACAAHDPQRGHRFPQHAALDAVAVVRGRGATLARVLHAGSVASAPR